MLYNDIGFEGDSHPQAVLLIQEKIMKKILQWMVVTVLSLAAVSVSAGVVNVIDFNSSITIGPTQAPNTWYTDRYAPAGFIASGGQLLETIISSDSATNRPVAFASTFYNTQGRKLDVGPGITGISVDLHIDSSWSTLNQRIAGLWGTAFNNVNTLTSYPILEAYATGSAIDIQGWNNGSFVDYGVLASTSHNFMHTLGITLNGAN